MSTWFIFAITALACYRIADILSSEEGPAGLFTRMRRQVPSKTNAGRGVRCPYCIGVWCSILATAALWWLSYVPAQLSVIYCFGVAGAQAALRRFTG